MYYEELGEWNKSVIVFLNAAGSTDTFLKQYVLLNQYHLVIPHFYGIGREQAHKYDLNDTVEGVTQIINHFESVPVYLVGFSLGAAVAMKVLCESPEKIKKAVIISGWFNASGISTGLMAFLVQISGGIRKKDKEMVKNWYRQVVRLKKGTREWCQYRDVKIPILGICGEYEIRSIKQSLLQLQQLNSYCKVEIWKEAGHNIPEILSGRLTNKLKEFFI